MNLMNVSINGQSIEDSKPVIDKTVKKWMSEKERRKLPIPKQPEPRSVLDPQTENVNESATNKTTESECQTDISQSSGDIIMLREQVRAACKQMLIDFEMDYGGVDDGDTDSEDSGFEF